MVDKKQWAAEEINRNQVTLLVPSTGDATRLRDFTEKVKQVSATGSLEIIGSWRENLITFELDKAITLANMINMLVSMPQVERVQENQVIKKRGTESQGILVILAS